MYCYIIILYICTACIYIYTQAGGQPIHGAATSGHIDVISTLVEKYGVDPQEKADVCMHANRKHIAYSQPEGQLYKSYKNIYLFIQLGDHDVSTN